MKVAFWPSKRLKQVKQILKTLEQYPETVRNLPYHKYRVGIYEWLLAYEEGRAGCTPKERLEDSLDNFYSQIHNMADPLDILITISVLYNYVHNQEFSNL
jgi:hypothetical protein